MAFSFSEFSPPRLPRFLKTVRRVVLQAIPTVILILLLNFALLQAAPGDAVDAMLSEAGDDAILQNMRQALHLGGGVLDQLLRYVNNLANFSLGTSLVYSIPVSEVVMERLGHTVILMTAAFVLALVIGSTLGILMALFSGSWIDRGLSIVAVLFYSTPSFWIGLMLIVVFAAHLGWLPSGGAGTIGVDPMTWHGLIDRARHLLLPALSASTFHIAIYARLMRASILEVRSQDFVRTAYAKGVSPSGVLFRHVIRNALIPLTTMAGMHVGSILGGAVVVETVYGWPGLGRLMIEAITNRDYPVLLGVLLMSSLLVIFANMVIDIIQTFLDPRIVVR
ncbi:MAG TPA: ABC transporter permease [Pseudolabrys sp.]|nr:ABC transporter permease [Pseudolabrys sp.]